jgi:hypothetical protein
MSRTDVPERAFELAVCARLEREGYVVGRQLGAGRRRIVDALAVEPGPAFDDRARITHRTIPPPAIEADVGPGRARPPDGALSCPPDRVEPVVEAAVEAGYLERERRDGRERVRATTRYPEGWFDRLIAVENKPDLGRPGDLELQVRKDLSLAVADAVVVATASRVTGAHRNRLPDEVGIWRVDPVDGSRTVVREPARLPVERGGIEILSTTPARWAVRPVTAAEKARLRRRLAERAYGKGWRVPPPGCARVRTVDPADVTEGDDGPVPGPGVPYCPWRGRTVAPEADCGTDWAGHEPAAPPAVDRAGAREATSPWRADPPGTARRQAGLDRFGDGEGDGDDRA